MKEDLPKDKSYYCDKSYGCCSQWWRLQHNRGNLGVVKKISINILKIKSIEVFYCCNWLMCLNHCKQNMVCIKRPQLIQESSLYYMQIVPIIFISIISKTKKVNKLSIKLSLDWQKISPKWKMALNLIKSFRMDFKIKYLFHLGISYC